VSGSSSLSPSVAGDAMSWQASRLLGRRSAATQSSIASSGRGFEPGEPGRLDVAVAGGAGAEAAAFADDAVDIVDDRATHQAPAVGHVDLDGLAVGLDIGDSSHRMRPGNIRVMLTAAPRSARSSP